MYIYIYIYPHSQRGCRARLRQESNKNNRLKKAHVLSSFVVSRYPVWTLCRSSWVPGAQGAKAPRPSLPVPPSRPRRPLLHPSGPRAPANQAQGYVGARVNK